jgi:hypothetical protein
MKIISVASSILADTEKVLSTDIIYQSVSKYFGRYRKSPQPPKPPVLVD